MKNEGNHLSACAAAFQVCLLLCLCTPARAETLTGIVKQPTSPFDPAEDSTVRLYDEGGYNEIEKPISTGKDGRYQFDVPRGTKVVVKAFWYSDKSSPGATPAVVSQNPTKADVRLQPARGSDRETWYSAGYETARSGSKSAVATAMVLESANIPAESRYQFILGAKSVAPGQFKYVEAWQIFDIDNSDSVTAGLTAAQDQFQKTKTLPTYAELNGELKKPVTQDVYFQVLGFIAPRGRPAWTEWQDALDKVVAPESKMRVSETALQFQYSVELISGGAGPPIRHVH